MSFLGCTADCKRHILSEKRTNDFTPQIYHSAALLSFSVHPSTLQRLVEWWIWDAKFLQTLSLLRRVFSCPLRVFKQMITGLISIW